MVFAVLLFCRAYFFLFFFCADSMFFLCLFFSTTDHQTLAVDNYFNVPFLFLSFPFLFDSPLISPRTDTPTDLSLRPPVARPLLALLLQSTESSSSSRRKKRTETVRYRKTSDRLKGHGKWRIDPALSELERVRCDIDVIDGRVDNLEEIFVEKYYARSRPVRKF